MLKTSPMLKKSPRLKRYRVVRTIVLRKRLGVLPVSVFLKKLRAPVIVLLLASVAYAFQETSPWRTFRSPEGKFSVLMPAEPKVQVQEADSAVGKLTLYSYSVSTKAAYLMASYGEYPREPTNAAHAERVLDNVRDGVLKSLAGEKLSETKITLKDRTSSSAAPFDYPGRELTAKKIHEGSEVYFTWRIYLVGRRLYQLAVVTSKADTTSPDVAKFLTSFQLAADSKQ